MQEAMPEVCPKKDNKTKNWYDKSRVILDGPTEARAEAQARYIENPTEANRVKLGKAKAELRHAVSKAKNDWTWSLAVGAEGIKVLDGAAPRCVSGAWEMVKELAATFTATFKMSSEVTMRDAGGNKTDGSSEANANVFYEWLKQGPFP